MKTIFRVIIIGFFLVVFVGSYFIESSSGPESFTAKEINCLSKASFYEYLDLLDAFVILSYSLLILVIVALIGLFFFWGPAKFLFIYMTIVANIVFPPFSKTDSFGMDFIFEALEISISALLIIISFTKPIKNEFSKVIRFNKPFQ